MVFLTKISKLFVFIGISLFLSTCADSVPTSAEDPVAMGGDDQSAVVGEAVALDGSGSFDMKNNSLSFSWKFAKVPPATDSNLTNGSFTLLNEKGSIAEFTPDIAGNYDLVLTVRNDDEKDADDVVIIVTNSSNTRPVAAAGDDQTDISVGTTVLLDGSGSTDLDDNTLTFTWAFSSVPPVTGSALTDSNLVSRSSDNSVVEFTPDTAGDYVIELTVSDGSATDTDPIIIRAI